MGDYIGGKFYPGDKVEGDIIPGDKVEGDIIIGDKVVGGRRKNNPIHIHAASCLPHLVVRERFTLGCTVCGREFVGS